MLNFKNVIFSYEAASTLGQIANTNLAIQEGQVVLICGESGCGKTTITRLINGLIPNYYEGKLTGKVEINGEKISEKALYEIAPMVGSVFQNPRSQFFAVDTNSELAFGCENMGWPEEKIFKRMDAIVSDFNIQSLMNRSIFALSGGEKQKIACASAVMLNPKILVLDEPSSNLDLKSIHELGEVIGLWKRQGKTIIIAEHRLSYLMGLVDRVLYMDHGKIAQDMMIGEFKALSNDKIASMGLRSRSPIDFSQHRKAPILSEKKITMSDLRFLYGSKAVLTIDSISIPKGSIVGIVGSNGAGKTTFARCMCGLERKAPGKIYMDGKVYSGKERLNLCYMVMQNPSHQLFTENVLDEVMLSMDKENEDQLAAEGILQELNLEELQERHPMSLSGGQQQRVAIASAVASGRELMFFDEPTSGLDFRHMEEVAAVLEKLQQKGKTIFLITHDPELIQRCCDYFIFMEHGQVKWCDGWSRETENRLNDFFNFENATIE